MTDIEKYIINSLITSPKNDKEIGFNSALITLLKSIIQDGPLDLHEVSSLNNSDSVTGQTLDVFGNVQLTEYQKNFRSAFNKITRTSDEFRQFNLTKIDVIIKLILDRNKLSAVKELKELTGLGLKEAKDVVDEFVEIINI